MQRFTLLHDGSDQGWQATYLAFHVAARLGAPLQAFILDPDGDKTASQQRAAQVEISGRAAGVTTKSHLLRDFSVEALKESMPATDGLFLPVRLIPDRESAARLLSAFSCPLWIASRASELPEISGMAIWVNDPIRDVHLIDYTRMLSHRLQQSLTGLIEAHKLDQLSDNEAPAVRWLALPTLALVDVLPALEMQKIDLLFMPASNLPALDGLPCNFVIYPETANT